MIGFHPCVKQDFGAVALPVAVIVVGLFVSPFGKASAQVKDAKSDDSGPREEERANTESNTDMSSASKRKPSATLFRMRADYRFQLNYDDHGYEEEDGFSPQKTAGFSQLVFTGIDFKTANKTHLHFYGGVLGGEEGDGELVFPVAKIVRKGPSWLRVTVGQDYLNLGGFDHKQQPHQLIMAGTYNSLHQPLGDKVVMPSAPLAEIKLEARSLGHVSVQATRDVKRREVESDTEASQEATYFNKTDMQPVAIVEIMGDLYGLQPLIQVASYDLNHSLLWTAGMRYDADLWGVSADYTSDKRVLQDPLGYEQVTTYNQTIVAMRGDIGHLGLLGKFAQMRVIQPDVDMLGNMDASTFDDNSLQVAAGLDWKADPAFSPFLMQIHETQKVLVTRRDPHKTDILSNNKTLIGVKGQF